MTNKVEMIRVSSSNVHSVGYNFDIKSVIVQFLDGSQYEYYNISEKEFLALRDANSVGQYLDQYYKKGHCYKYSKIR
ncbi:MAG: KTSC domain-containing protein [Burkholderiales bacterium]|nr:KTSC domain-containing protein [Burkholderiales bacterium]